MYFLKYRSKGKSVKLLQELLNSFGQDLKIDGYFGRMTEAGVKTFQEEQQLAADGLVFTRTWGKLLLQPPSVLKRIDVPSEEVQKHTQQLLKKGKKGDSVVFLQELLNNLDYNLNVDGDFGPGTERAVKNFQAKQQLVADGIVFTKTWTKLLELAPPVTINEKDISERDIEKFATDFDLEVPIVKAVQEVESSGKGFLADNRPTILFEGHIFWRELKKRGFDPNDFVNGNEDILFSRWTKAFYKGKAAEYERLMKAEKVGKSHKILEAALASCSWGRFQVMGFNYHKSAAFDLVDYVTKMKRSEAEHLTAFGSFIKATKLLKPLREKRWADFARGYNGPAFKQNKYDEKLEAAYLKYKNDLLD